jgi:1-deoxy-D-xylulose-5-phosphate reductoisomerase
VEAFLGGRIKFTDIPQVIEKTMAVHQPHALTTIEEVLFVDRWGREKTRELMGLRNL